MSRRLGRGREVATRVLVIGGSAGALAPLAALVGSLPIGISAAALVTIHRKPGTPSFLPAILDRRTDYRATEATDRTTLRSDWLYTAPPDHHLLVERGLARVRDGPKIRGQRPSIDLLFRSAAEAYGPAVVAVLLAGNLDDGSAGLVSVREHGGTAIVIDPADALFPGMPSAALVAAGPIDPVRLEDLPGRVAAALSDAAALP